MGRGLSKLQTWILRRAGELKCVYYADVLEGFFGWKPNEPMIRYRAKGINRQTGRKTEPGWAGVLISPGSARFSPEAIGEAHYRKTIARLNRSCLRLDKRGLVTCLRGRHWAGVEITDKGREWLSVNDVDNWPPH
jgi:hypothetical protein